MECMNCKVEFEAKRADAKYCSPKCRVYAKRNKSVTDKVLSVTNSAVSVTGDLSVTTKPVSVTNTEQPIRLTLKNDTLMISKPDASVDLPDCVPAPIRSAYARLGSEYQAVIDRLLAHTRSQLQAANIWIPCWRHKAGECAT